jgi:hypothetical protein
MKETQKKIGTKKWRIVKSATFHLLYSFEASVIFARNYNIYVRILKNLFPEI